MDSKTVKDKLKILELKKERISARIGELRNDNAPRDNPSQLSQESSKHNLPPSQKTDDFVGAPRSKQNIPKASLFPSTDKYDVKNISSSNLDNSKFALPPPDLLPLQKPKKTSIIKRTTDNNSNLSELFDFLVCSIETSFNCLHYLDFDSTTISEAGFKLSLVTILSLMKKEFRIESEREIEGGRIDLLLTNDIDHIALILELKYIRGAYLIIPELKQDNDGLPNQLFNTSIRQKIRILREKSEYLDQHTHQDIFDNCLHFGVKSLGGIDTNEKFPIALKHSFSTAVEQTRRYRLSLKDHRIGPNLESYTIYYGIVIGIMKKCYYWITTDNSDAISNFQFPSIQLPSTPVQSPSAQPFSFSQSSSASSPSFSLPQSSSASAQPISLPKSSQQFSLHPNSKYDDKCFSCGEHGHWSSACPKKKKSTKPGPCYTCGQFGHWSLECPKRHTVHEQKSSTARECFRCGRTSHWAENCYARTHIDGYYLSDDDEHWY